MKSHILKAISYIPLTIGLTTACGRGASKSTDTDNQASVHIVDTTSVIRLRIDVTETFTAIVQSKVKNNISPQTPLRIERMMVEVGDIVKKGQVLAKLDNSNLDRLKVQLDNAELEFKRTDELYKVGGLAKAKWDQSKSTFDIARSQYYSMLENTILRSPIGGVVTARNYDNGDLSSPQLPIYVVEQISPVKLKLNISEGYYRQVKPKMPVDVSVEAFPNETFDGHVSLVYPTIDPTSHTFGVEVEVSNNKQLIRPGMYARANLHLGEKDVLAVQTSAINKLAGTGERFVYVLNDGKAERRSIETGIQRDSFTEVTHGLKEKDIVVAHGAANLKDGQEVTIKAR